MTIRNDVTADEFLEAFQEADRQMGAELSSAYKRHPSRTDVMLRENGFADKICQALASRFDKALEFKREWYTIDALFVGGEELIYPEGAPDRRNQRLWYPSRLPVLIEHENGEDIEEEMWKLMFWKAGLKVIITYDYCLDEYDDSMGRRSEGLKKSQYAPRKLATLRGMFRKVHGETEQGSEYLLILGNRESWAKDTPTKWQWCRIDVRDHDLRPLSIA